MNEFRLEEYKQLREEINLRDRTMSQLFVAAVAVKIE